MTKQSPKVTLSDTVELTKDKELMEKLRESRELREKLMKAENGKDALKAINESGIDMTDDEFDKIAMKQFEIMVFNHKMAEKGAKIYDSGHVERSVWIIGAPSITD